METVLHETRGAVTLLTLNRPEKLNALNYAMIDRLMARLDAAEADPSVGAVILTGAGGRHPRVFRQHRTQHGRSGAGVLAQGASDDRAP